MWFPGGKQAANLKLIILLDGLRPGIERAARRPDVHLAHRTAYRRTQTHGENKKALLRSPKANRKSVCSTTQPAARDRERTGHNPRDTGRAEIELIATVAA